MASADIQKRIFTWPAKELQMDNESKKQIEDLIKILPHNSYGRGWKGTDYYDTYFDYKIGNIPNLDKIKDINKFVERFWKKTCELKKIETFNIADINKNVIDNNLKLLHFFNDIKHNIKNINRTYKNKSILSLKYPDIPQIYTYLTTLITSNKKVTISQNKERNKLIIYGLSSHNYILPKETVNIIVLYLDNKIITNRDDDFNVRLYEKSKNSVYNAISRILNVKSYGSCFKCILHGGYTKFHATDTRDNGNDIIHRTIDIWWFLQNNNNNNNVIFARFLSKAELS